MKSSLSYLYRADGSCLYSRAGTTVVASIDGPGDLKASKQLANCALVQASVRSRVTAGAGVQNAVVSLFVEKLCRSVVAVRMFPKTLISIVVQELESDGSLMEAAVNSVCLALLDSGLPIRDTFAAATVAVPPGTDQLILHPTAQAQQNAEAVLTAVFLEHQSDAVYSSWSSGIFSPQKMEVCLRKAQEACTEMLSPGRLSRRDIYRLLSSRPVKGAAPEVYDCEYVEAKWYDWWMRNNYFNPPLKSDRAKPYVMLLPPPNVTGDLHVGHALTVTIEDCIARSHRMSGEHVVWIPGFDHAGLALQLVVERHIQKQHGVTRKDMSYQDFLQVCNTWSKQKMGSMTEQLKRLGASLDWSRRYYTLDETFSRAVYHAFKDLHASGLLYRDHRVVNWSPVLQSCLSDVEVETRRIDNPTEIQIPGRQNPVSLGYMYFVKYPLLDAVHQHLVVATTRPETMLADVALAVNPHDLRYSHLIGRYAGHPLLAGKRLPIICDERVSPDKGTGVVKITPAHSQTDFDIAKANGLPIGQGCIDASGRLVSRELVSLDGLERFEGRDAIVTNLIDRELLTDCQSQPLKVPICRRTGDILEPLAKEQWFLSCTQMAQRTLDVLPRMNILPPGMRSEWKNWLSHRVDWCLSRQSWWGHRIPAYMAKLTDGSCTWIVAQNDREAALQLKDVRPVSIVQDPDVLDTWFSSALIPLVVAGWPNRWSPDGQQPLFPLSLMETGHDILGFWVARMAMLCLQLTQDSQLPFTDVLLHGMLRDAQGQKMSKSRGNVLDPMMLVNRQGAGNSTGVGVDALRMALLKTSIKGDTVALDEAAIQRNSKFCNKLWQSFKYMSKVWNGASVDRIDADWIASIHPTAVDKWILSRLASLVKEVLESMEAYNLHVIVEAMTNFWWFEFCDVYLEWSKGYFYPRDTKGADVVRCILAWVADVYLRLLAPYMPYLTEELYTRVPYRSQEVSVHAAPYPVPDEVPFLDPHLEIQMRFVRDLIHHVRSFRRDLAIGPSAVVQGTAKCVGVPLAALENFQALLRRTVHLHCSVEGVEGDCNVPDNCVALISQEDCLVYVQLQDVNYEEVLNRFDRHLRGLEKKRSKLMNRLNAIRRQVASGETAELKISSHLHELGSLDQEATRFAQFRRAVEAKANRDRVK